MGRVDRIGQTAARTLVHRFVVQRSVEENVHRLCSRRAAGAAAAAASTKKDDAKLTVG